VTETPDANQVAGMKWLLGVHNKQRARRMIAHELKRLGWVQGELTRRRKGDRQKVAPARRLRAETTMSLPWIEQRLRMGSWSSVSNLLRTTKTANSDTCT
jgi:hypothetical protein